MSNYIEIAVLVEGKTEEIFIKSVLQPYLADKNIYITPIILSKPGEKGGDVKFSRAIKDISLHLKQRNDTYVTLMVDYYGIKKDWPGLEAAGRKTEPGEIAAEINRATQIAVNTELNKFRSDERFLPNIVVHEFESLLFSDSEILASVLGVDQAKINRILDDFGDPEKINNSVETAPSKQLEKLSTRFKKTSTGIKIAKTIGIEKIRTKCFLFNKWVSSIESLIDETGHSFS